MVKAMVCQGNLKKKLNSENSWKSISISNVAEDLSQPFDSVMQKGTLISFLLEFGHSSELNCFVETIWF